MSELVLPPPNRLNEVDPKSDEGRLLFEESPAATQAWIEHFLSTANELGQVVPFKLYPQQIKILQDETGRDIIVKGRQTRASTIVLARNLRPLVTGQLWGATCVIGAQDDQTTAVFRKKVQHHLYNDLANKGVKLKIKDNADELIIEDFGNRILWVSGEQRTMSRGFAAQMIHFSEFAHWKDTALELLGGAIPAVPASPFGRIMLESTPKGEVGAFYKYASEAKGMTNKPDALWTVHLYPWWLEPRYTVSDNPLSGNDIVLSMADLQQRTQNLVLTDFERKLQREHNLRPDQIIWRRLKKEEQDRTHAPFLQEYPEDLDTCWLGVEGKFFDTPDGIDHLEYYRDSRKGAVKLFERLNFRGAEVPFFGHNLAVWEFPDASDTYVIGFDSAGGGMGSEADWSVAYVASVRKEKFVARLRVQASPKNFAHMLAAVGTMFNSATINGESDARGRLIFEELRDMQYRQVHYHIDPLKPVKNQVIEPGMFPTTQNRQNILEKLKTGITNHALESFCEELVREMNVFTWVKYGDRIRAMADKPGQHDDCIFAAAYTWWIIDKVRNRMKRDWDFPEEIVVDSVGQVISRGPRNAPMQRQQQLWFGV